MLHYKTMWTHTYTTPYQYSLINCIGSEVTNKKISLL